MFIARASIHLSAWLVSATCWGSSALLVATALTTGCAANNGKQENTEPPATGQVKDIVQITPVARWFAQGVHAPIDLLYFESPDGSPGTYYLVELTMRTDHDGVVSIVDMDTHERLLDFYLDAREAGLVAMGIGSPHLGLSDFVLDSYTHWCGEWHQGINNYWQFCTGSDCSTASSAQWCTKKVDKQACEAQGTCPTSASTQD